MRFRPSARVLGITYAIRELIALARDMEVRTGERVIYLSSGDPTKYGFKPPEEAVEALKLIAEKNCHGYGDFRGDLLLRERIAKYEKAKTGVGLSADDVVVAAGSIRAFSALVASLLEPGDSLLLPDPYYAPYKSIVELNLGRPAFYKIEPSGGSWRIDFDDLRRKLREGKGRIKGAVLINPNNPTGAVFGPKDVQEFIDIVLEHGALPIFDEAYDLFVYEGAYSNAASLLKSECGVVLNSFSKSLFLCGWRVGYLYGVGDCASEVVEGVKKAMMLAISGPNPLQKALAELLGRVSPADFVRGVLPEIRRRRDAFLEALEETELFETIRPQGAFYVFPRIARPGWEAKDREFVLRLLEKEKILIIHGSGFGENGAGRVRIVFLAEQPVAEEVARRLIRFRGWLDGG